MPECRLKLHKNIFLYMCQIFNNSKDYAQHTKPKSNPDSNNTYFKNNLHIFEGDT